ncbi:hypothetical protein F0L68_01215 [Solihabitans fulvus]|uniref:Uncharacterized protein n=1 Tax=Solihabitans fulvus TaxID=1892852 RepID=A0A5B2XVI5_9PSEU|nr:hypothetical protein [Solihabitans fulvus]KAA2267175.1 hypothetical protein F0L68_01215 [Solihabitans fulvus]
MGAGDEINGETDAMREFSRHLAGSVQLERMPKAVSRHVAAACGGGLRSCEVLTKADQDSTDFLHTFITDVVQGFAAYSSFVHRSAAAYVAADETGRQGILAALDGMTGQGLPAIIPELDTTETR